MNPSLAKTWPGAMWDCVGSRGHAWASRGHAWARVGMRGHLRVTPFKQLQRCKCLLEKLYLINAKVEIAS